LLLKGNFFKISKSVRTGALGTKLKELGTRAQARLGFVARLLNPPSNPRRTDE